MTQSYNPRRHGRTSETDPENDTVREEWEHCRRLEQDHGGTWAPTGSIFLRDDLQPRIESGLDNDIARRYADAFDQLPPVTVQRGTLHLIDGRHRVRAAYLASPQRYYIRVNEVDVPDEELIDHAVKANVGHGRAATQKERMYWAKDFLRRHPDWSDARIAEWTGAGARSVWEFRSKLAAHGDIETTSTRVGVDGRARTVTAESRAALSQIARVDEPAGKAGDAPALSQIARVDEPVESEPEDDSDEMATPLGNVEGGKPAGYFPVGTAVIDMGTGHVYRVEAKAGGFATLVPVGGGDAVRVPVTTPLRYRQSSLVMADEAVPDDEPDVDVEDAPGAPDAVEEASGQPVRMERVNAIVDAVTGLANAIDDIADPVDVANALDPSMARYLLTFGQPSARYLSAFIDALKRRAWGQS